MENLAGEVEQMTLQGGKLALKVFQAITIVQEKRSVTVEVFIPSPFNYLVPNKSGTALAKHDVIKAKSTRRRLQTQTIVNAYFYLHPHEDDHRLRSVSKFIHFGVRFRIYAFTVSVFIVFVWTEGLNA